MSSLPSQRQSKSDLMPVARKALEELVDTFGAARVEEGIKELVGKKLSLREPNAMGRYLFENIKRIISEEHLPYQGHQQLNWTELSVAWRNLYVRLGKEVIKDFNLDFNQYLKF